MRSKEENLYETYNVPGLGKVMPDGTYWTFINATELNQIKAHGMTSPSGRKCLGFQNIEDKIIAQWRK